VTFRSDAILATEDIIDALGEPVLFQSKSGTSKTITAVFEREYFDLAYGSGVSSSQPVLSAKSSDGPFKEYDLFLVDNQEYRAVNLDRDADGQTRIGLEKNG